MAPSTFRRYETAFAHWKSFLTSEEDPTCAAPHRYGAYLEHAIEQGKSLSFLETVTAAISHFHLAAFHTSPTSHPASRRALVAARKLLATPVKRAKPLTPSLLRDVHDVATRQDDFVTWRTYWRMSMCFHGLMRWSDVSVLQVKHIRASRSSLHITIPRSKTDQVGQGCDLVISASPGSPYCPVSLTRRYLTFFSSEDGWLQSCQSSSPGPKRPAERHRLSYATSLSDLRRLIQLTGRDPKDFSEHSGRRGGASLAHRAGLSWLDIKRMGRWTSDSASQKYIDVTPGPVNPVSASLARCVSGSSVSSVRSSPNTAPATSVAVSARGYRGSLKWTPRKQ